MSNTEPEEKQSFMDKLKHPFRTHSRSSSSVKSGELDTSHLLFDHSNLASLSAHDKGVLESAYIEGQRHAEKKYNRKVSRYGFPVIGALGSGNQGSGSNYGSTYGSNHGQLSSDDRKVIDAAYIEGKNSYHANSKGATHGTAGAAAAAGAALAGAGAAGHTSSKGRVVSSSSAGKVVTAPPEVRREPVDRLAPGDFANEKNPTDLSVLGGAGGAAAAQQRGGELSQNTNPVYTNDTEVHEGTGVFYNPKDTQGGVVGNADTTNEATAAHLDKNRNLKTKPSVYEQQDREQEIKDAAYEHGNKEARRDAAEGNKDSSRDAHEDSKSSSSGSKHNHEDPSEVHQTNKSAYNNLGVSGVVDSLRGKSHKNDKNDQYDPRQRNVTGTSAHTTAPLDSSNHTGTGAGAGATGPSHDSRGIGSNTGSNTGSGSHSGGLGAGVGAGVGAGAAAAAAKNASHKNDAGAPPSSSDFDYEREFDALNAKIARTEREIESLESLKKNKPEFNEQASTTAVYHEPYSPPHERETSGNSAASYLKPAALAGAVGGALGFGSASHGKTQPIDDSYNQGVKAGAYDSGSSKAIPSDLNRGLKGGSKDYDTSGAGSGHGTGYGAGSGTGTDSGVHDDGSSKPGILDGAKGALGAAGAVAAGALGYGAADASSVKSEAYQAGQDKFHREQGRGGTALGAGSHPTAHGHNATGSSGHNATGASSHNATGSDRSGHTNALAVAGSTKPATSGSQSVGALDNSKSVNTENTDDSAYHRAGNAGVFGAIAGAAGAAGAAIGMGGHERAGETREAGHTGHTGNTDSLGHTEPGQTGSGNTDRLGHSGTGHSGINDRDIRNTSGVSGPGSATGSTTRSTGSTGSTLDPKAHHDKIASPSLDRVEDDDDTNTSQSSGIIGGITGALGGAAAAIGLGGRSDSDVSRTDADRAHSGTTGSTGSTGISGTTKTAGSTGSTKPTGISGTTNTGTTGPTGISGSTKPGNTAGTSTTRNEGERSGVTGALASAAGAVGSLGAAGAAATGLSGSNKASNEHGSLIEPATGYEDVRNAPKHAGGKSTKDVDESSNTGDGVQGVPGLVPSTGDDVSSKKKEKSDTNARNVEAEVTAHNRKHGVTDDKRSLIEIAEGVDPEIKELGTHKQGPTVGESESSTGAEGGVQEVPAQAYANQNEFIRSGGKRGEIEGGSGASHATSSTGAVGKDKSLKHDVSPAPEGKKKSSLIESDTAGKKKSPIESSGRGLDSADQSTAESHHRDLGYGAAAVGTGAGLGSVIHAKDNRDHRDLDTRREVGNHGHTGTSEYGQPGHSSAGYGQSHSPSGHTSGTSAGYGSGHSAGRDISDEAYNSGVRSGAYEAGNVNSAKDVSRTENAEDNHHTGAVGAVLGALGVGAGAKHAHDHHNQGHHQDYNQDYNQGYNQGHQGHQGSHLASGSTGYSGLSESDRSAFYEAGVVQGAREAGHIQAARELSEKPSHHGATGAAVGAAAGTAGASGLGHRSAAGSSAPGLTGTETFQVEVIGVKDREQASKIAHQTCKDLDQKGVDLTSGKLIVNAETNEVYKVDETSGPQGRRIDQAGTAGVGAAGAGLASSGVGSGTGAGTGTGVGSGTGRGTHGTSVNQTHGNRDISSGSGSGFGSGSASALAGAGLGAGAGAGAGTAFAHHSKGVSQPDASFKDDLEEPDLQLRHREHEKAKARLAHAADEGVLGNVAPPTEQPVSGNHGREAVVGGGATAAALAAGNYAKHNHEPRRAQDVGHGSGKEDRLQPSDILVTVQGTSNNSEATKLAHETVNELQDQPDVLKNVKEIQIDSQTGVVTDERGNVIEHVHGQGQHGTNTGRQGGVGAGTAGAAGSSAAAAGYGSGAGASGYGQRTEPGVSGSGYGHESSAGSGYGHTTGSSAPGSGYGQSTSGQGSGHGYAGQGTESGYGHSTATGAAVGAAAGAAGAYGSNIGHGDRNTSLPSSTGAHGTSGLSGSHGATGTSGAYGTSGSQGTSGSHGTYGTSGTTGTSGTGLSGSRGVTGTSSSHGSTGTHGTSGDYDTTGTHGASGVGSGYGASGLSGAGAGAGTYGSGADHSSGTGYSDSRGLGSHTGSDSRGLDYGSESRGVNSHSGSTTGGNFGASGVSDTSGVSASGAGLSKENNISGLRNSELGSSEYGEGRGSGYATSGANRGTAGGYSRTGDELETTDEADTSQIPGSFF